MIKRAKDRYHWRVVYRDGTHTDEYDETRKDGRGWSEREDKPIEVVRLVTSGHTHCVQVPTDAMPVFFRRRTLSIHSDIDEHTPLPAIHCIGWARGDEAVYLFVYDDNSTVLTTNLQAG